MTQKRCPEDDETKSEDQHADYTGYAGATTNAYAKGAVTSAKLCGDSMVLRR